MSRHILFSGCAAQADRRPARSAMLDLARTLRLDLVESPISACCGARSTQDDEAPNVSHLLTPLLAAAHAGQDLVCLSPTCRCAMSAHLTRMAGEDRDGNGAAKAAVPRVRDCVDLLTSEDDGRDRLQALPRRLGFLRAALHLTCHGDHNPVRWQPEDQAAQLSLLAESAALPTAGAADAALAQLVGATGATVLDDVSAAGGCDEVALPPGKRTDGGEGPACVRCLGLAAGAGADVLITPCARCYGDLHRYQQQLQRGDRDRAVPVLHVAQLLNLACIPGEITWVYGG